MVPASTSMAIIEKALVEAGATDISKKCENQVCVAIRFRMMVNLHPLFCELPARVDACFEVLWKELKRQQADTKLKIRQQ